MHRIIPILVVAALVSGEVQAQEQADSRDGDPVAEAMHAWFDGERTGALTFGATGLVSVGAGAYLFTREAPFAKGVSYPTLGLGGLLIVGATAYLFAIPSGRQEMADLLAEDRARFLTEELDHMEGVARRFHLYRAIQLAVLGAGAGLTTWGALDDRPVVTGIGVGIVAEAVNLLILDFFAERRSHRYLDVLRAHQP